MIESLRHPLTVAQWAVSLNCEQRDHFNEPMAVS